MLRDQRWLSYVALGLLLGTQNGRNSCFEECNHLCSVLSTKICLYLSLSSFLTCRCDHRNPTRHFLFCPANVDLRLSVLLISVQSVENGFESVSFTTATSIFCFASFLLFGQGAPLPSGWYFHKNESSGREQTELLLHIALYLLFQYPDSG